MKITFVKKIFAWLSDFFMMPDWLASIFIWLFRCTVLFLLIFFFFRYKEVKQSYDRVLKDGYLSQSEIQYYKAQNGEIVAKQNVQTNTIKELQSLNSFVCRELDNLRIKYKHLQQYSETVFNTSGTVIAPIVSKDTIIIVNSDVEQVISEIFRYSDKYLSLVGYRQDNKKLQIISYNYTDSIAQFTHFGDRISKRGKRMPIWWFFTKKCLQQSIKASNPATTIKYNKTVNIVK